jgi:hypothetical protein
VTEFFRSFRRSEEGSATIEFVIWFPLFWGLFIWSFEQGMYLARQVVLDRAVDLAVRNVRLGAFDDLVDSGQSGSQQTAALHDAVKERVCEFAFMIPDCLNQLRLEMQQVNPRSWSMLDGSADCVDRAAPGRPAGQFTAGQSNQLMVLRACALIDPHFPSSGLGARLEKVSGGAYALVAVTSFAIEPTSNSTSN